MPPLPIRPFRRLASLAAALAASAPALALAQAATDLGAPAAASEGRGPLVFFWIVAVATVGGAIATVSARNTINAVMSLVGTFFGVAALYALLGAHFLAVIQVLVYAGAIMTLFVFVVMVLNREEQERFSARGVVTRGIGIFAAAYIVLRTAAYFAGDLSIATRAEAPPAGWGGVADIGMQLFTRHLFSFEAISLPLLVAVIGAVVVARTPRRHLREHEGGLSHSAVDEFGDPIPVEPPADDDHAAPAAAHDHH